MEPFLKLLEYDTKFAETFKNFQFIGIDEVGRGALAGPVVACAFCWQKKLDVAFSGSSKTSLRKLNDSKQLNNKDRKKLYKELMRFGNFGIGYASVLEIEKINILNATFLAMKRAYENLILKFKLNGSEHYVLIDGNKFNPFINCRQIPIIRGDAKSSLIASASIIAKVYRDTLIQKIAKAKPFKHYGWRTNVGYGTAFHREAIKKHGATPLHRKLFIRKVTNQLTSYNNLIR